MKSRYPYILAIAVIFVFCMTTFMASLAEARGGRGGGGRGGGGRGGGGHGGGGFSRSSPAAGGGFSSRSAAHKPSPRQSPRQETRKEKPRTPDRDSGNHQENRDDAREDRQQHRDDARDDSQQHRDNAREDRQDFVEDEWDDHRRRRAGAALVTGVAIGAAAHNNYVYSVPCSTTIIVGSMTYYHCSSTWYSRGYEGGEVVYIITSAPAGH